MPNTSATGGTLAPATAPRPLLAKSLNRLLQEWAVGITGLPDKMMRPRLQLEPPNIPDQGTAWCAFGVVLRRAETFPYVSHVPQPDPDDSYDQLARHEELDVLFSFYDSGLDQMADEYAMLLREGAQVPQNRDLLLAQNINLVSTGDLIPLPSLMKERWLYRVDLQVTLRRQIVLNYPVLEIEASSVVIKEDTSPVLTQNVSVTPPS